MPKATAGHQELKNYLGKKDNGVLLIKWRADQAVVAPSPNEALNCLYLLKTGVVNVARTRAATGSR